MSETLVPAYLAHTLPGRLRIRIPDKRGDQRYFDELCEALTNRSEVLGASANAGTASVVLKVAVGIGSREVAERAKTLGLFDLTNPRIVTTRSALTTASVGFQGIDSLLGRASGGYLDARSTIFLALLIMAGRQIYKGHFMVPGFTFLWYALTLMWE